MRSTHLFALATASLLSLSAQAAPVFYTTEADFLAVGVQWNAENFQGYNKNKHPNTGNLDSGLNISSNTAFTFQEKSDGCEGKNGKCISFTTPSTGSLQTFTFDIGSVNAFGIFLGDLGTMGITQLTLTNSNGAITSYKFDKLTSNNELYFGIFDPMTAFTSVSLSNSRSGDVVFIDNVSWGKSPVIAPQSASVPEPGMLALLGACFAGIALARRRRD